LLRFVVRSFVESIDGAQMNVERGAKPLLPSGPRGWSCRWSMCMLRIMQTSTTQSYLTHGLIDGIGRIACHTNITIRYNGTYLLTTKRTSSEHRTRRQETRGDEGDGDGVPVPPRGRRVTRSPCSLPPCSLLPHRRCGNVGPGGGRGGNTRTTRHVSV
jgi:hypothetical protein